MEVTSEREGEGKRKAGRREKGGEARERRGGKGYPNLSTVPTPWRRAVSLP